ncbi:MAG: lytic transglycosylase domain-containing protein [Byssovorax sp.]
MIGRRQKRMIAGAAAAVAVLVPALWIARSPPLRASFAAAAAAFRDPSRLRAPGEGDDRPPAAAPPLAPIDLDQPDISGDFGPISGDALRDAILGDPALAGLDAGADAGVDAGAAASLVLPDLGFAVSQRTMRFVAYFASGEKGRAAFSERFRRAGRYRDHIEQALRDAELPEDLLWLAAIESGFNPQAMSPKGAAGLFQFMPETGEKYGLAVTELVDDRRSIIKSTKAATAHLRDLFKAYGRWDLALAAYNYGREPLDEAIEKLRARRSAKEKDKPVDFKDLAEAKLIPRETANFVPQIQAFAIVAANRGRFGLDDLEVASPFDLGEIAVPAGTPLRLVAKAAGVSVAVLRDYNPDLLRDVVPGAGGDALVAVPADRVARALAAFPALQAREPIDAGADAASGAPSAASARATPSAKASASASAPRESAPADAASAARRKASEARRRVLEKVPYGSSWLALGDRVFPAGRPFAGSVLVAPVLPLLSVAIADRADWAMDDGPLLAPLPREERVSVTLPVPSPRAIFAWIGPPSGDSGGAALKLAMLALAHHDFGRVSLALIQTTHMAVHLRGLLDVGDRGSVAAFEAVPAVQHDVAAVELELDRALDRFASEGPTGPELASAKEQLRGRLQAERGRGAGAGETKVEMDARIARTLERAERVTADELRALVKEVFVREKRVVVVSVPRG